MEKKIGPIEFDDISMLDEHNETSVSAVASNDGLEVQANEPYTRREDMTSEGKLTVIMQEDGDMIVTVYGESLSPDRMHSASVEFCTPWSGGGRSRHTRKALQDLAIAIQKDNLERAL